MTLLLILCFNPVMFSVGQQRPVLKQQNFLTRRSNWGRVYTTMISRENWMSEPILENYS